eukprot:657324-Pleurochrysis_carterae.AAC.1
MNVGISLTLDAVLTDPSDMHTWSRARLNSVELRLDSGDRVLAQEIAQLLDVTKRPIQLNFATFKQGMVICMCVRRLGVWL